VSKSAKTRTKADVVVENLAKYERIFVQRSPDAAEMPGRLLRKPVVLAMAGGIDDSTAWRWEQLGRFPRRIRISSRLTVWRESEVLDWLKRQGSQEAAS
jgi:predicted DNA-binding transcriptional regulator AlpA